MTPPVRMILGSALLFAAAVVPGLGQNTGAKVVPKLQPIAETKLLMEGLANPNFRGLERNLSKNPIDDQTWTYARGQALLIAECANLLMLRPPKGTQSQPTWFQETMDLRTQATRLAQSIAKKDLASAKAGMQNLARSCNRCHQSFRVPVDIVPFQPVPPPVRKI
ncbi:MAG: cytochrome c [Planctomycetes bacterium]|nr:cytochrome c [Planctomycetota bacterium]